MCPPGRAAPTRHSTWADGIMVGSENPPDLLPLFLIVYRVVRVADFKVEG